MPTPQNGQTHANNSSALADNLFECGLPFFVVGTCGWRWLRLWLYIFGLICLWYSIDRSNGLQRLCKTGVVKDFAKVTEKQLSGSLFSNQVAGWRPATLFKMRLRHIGFPVNFAKRIRTPFLQDTRGVRFWVDTQPKLNVSRRSQAIEVQEVLYLCRIHLGHVPRQQPSLALEQLT